MLSTETLKKLFEPAGLDEGPWVTIRYARPDDALALLDLADLDSCRAPSGTVAGRGGARAALGRRVARRRTPRGRPVPAVRRASLGMITQIVIASWRPSGRPALRRGVGRIAYDRPGLQGSLPALLVLYLCWGSSVPAMKVMVGSIPPLLGAGPCSFRAA
jgi:hypothetical protein